MRADGPLAGRTVVVTRPQAQAAPLAEAIAAAGGLPLVFPLLEISPAADAQPLAEAVARLDEYAVAVFISPNAVDYALPAMFIALLILQIKGSRYLLVAAVAGVLSIVIWQVGVTQWNVLLATLIAATLGAGVETWTKRR